jgi:hypothetical protein
MIKQLIHFEKVLTVLILITLFPDFSPLSRKKRSHISCFSTDIYHISQSQKGEEEKIGYSVF